MAFFGASNRTSLVFAAGSASVDGWTFLPGAPAYDFYSVGSVTFQSTGIVANGASVSIVNAGGSSVLWFAGAASAATSTITNGGLLQFSDTSTAAEATITSSRQIRFQNQASAGAATIENAVFGAINFLNASSAGDATITNAGGLNFFGQTTADHAQIVNSGSGRIQFLSNSVAASAGLSNAGSLQFLGHSSAQAASITNAGTLGFQEFSTAGNATIINDGTLVFQDNATGGGARVVNNAGALLTIAPSSGPAGDGLVTLGSLEGGGDVQLGTRRLQLGSSNLSTTISGAITDGGGEGSLEKVGTGTLVLTGANDYAGGTFVDAGVLQLGDGRAGGSVTGDITNDATLAVDRSDTLVLDGSISGSGLLRQTGTGTLMLTGASTYTGATQVLAGTLSVNGSIADSALTTVARGATLAGTGEVGDTRIEAGGRLSPGNSIGTLRIVGNLTLGAGAIYVVEVSPASADRADVTGVARLGGTVQASFAPGSYVQKRYVIVDAQGGRSGAFAGVANTNLPSGFTSSLSYDAGHAYLDLALRFVPQPPTPQPPTPRPPPDHGGLPDNQQHVADTLADYLDRTGRIPTVFGMLTPSGLSQVSGELGTAGIQPSVEAMGAFMAVMLDPTAAQGQRRECTGQPRQQPALPFGCWSIWAAGYGSRAFADGEAPAGSHDVDSHLYGLAAGADYRAAPDLRLGFGIGGGGTRFRLDEGLGRGSSDLFQAGLYGRQELGPAYLAAALAYGWQAVDADRTVTAAGLDRFTADYDSRSLSGRIEGGHRFDLGAIGLTPYAAGEVVRVHLPAYVEHRRAGANPFALDYEADTTTAGQSELGFKLENRAMLGQASLSLDARAAWAHAFGRERAVTAGFQALGGASFTVEGAAPDADAALVSAGAEIGWENGVSLAATLDGTFGDGSQAYAAKGTLRYVW